MTDLKIEQIPTSKIIKYARNARLHSDDQVAQIAASIGAFGFCNPVLLDADGTLIAGHGRVMAAEKLGVDTVPAIRLGHLTIEQAAALRVADNSLALNSTWDLELLRSEIVELEAAGFDPLLLALPDDMMFPPAMGNVDPEEAPEPSTAPMVRTGDIWVMGGHRIICGDATNADDVAAVLGGAKPHLMVTDPPYGVDYDANWRNEADRANGKPYGDRAIGKVQNDNRSDWREAWALFSGDVLYAWHPAGAMEVSHYNALLSVGFEVRTQIVWAKQQFSIGRGNYHVQHEPCWYAVRKGKTRHWSGDRKQTTLWKIDKPHKSESGHSTQKPIECMRRPIENNSRRGDYVYEPFSGSGTTIIAAEMTGRKCLAIEINPGYVQVAVERWQKFSGKIATLAATGQSFDDVVAERSSTPTKAKGAAPTTPKAKPKAKAHSA